MKLQIVHDREGNIHAVGHAPGAVGGAQPQLHVAEGMVSSTIDAPEVQNLEDPAALEQIAKRYRVQGEGDNARLSPHGGGSLTLPQKDLRKNTAALFEGLQHDEKARQKFMTNPVGQVAKLVVGRELAPQQESAANRVLFAMLANREFMKWLDEYRGPGGKPATREQFGRDFAQAVVRFGDQDLFKAVVGQAAAGLGFPGEVAQQLVTGPEKSVATPAATPSTSDQTAHSSSNANSVAFGDPAVVDPAFMRSIIQQLMDRAQQLKQQGELGNMDAAIR
uniref:Uncharacterized protein n=1 Tax=Solibacter usitatus (strain Ellin6076) TaxID=234267 RepID=Q01Z15_SOLUE